jgi:hypothetical protein
MDATVQEELCALVGTVVGQRAPLEEDTGLVVHRPDRLELTDWGWLDDLAGSIVQEVLLSFDLRKKTGDEEPEELERWKWPASGDDRLERRRDHRLRIRTTIDDLFEKSFPSGYVSATARAWKIQIADKCADAILDRFHVRPAASGPWALYRRSIYDVGQDLQQALGQGSLFLMTGRLLEAKAMEAAIERALSVIHKLIGELEQGDPSGRTDI